MNRNTTSDRNTGSFKYGNMGGGHMFTITHKSNKRVYLNFPKNVNNYMCLTNISMNIWNLYACKDRNRKRNYC